MLFFFHIAFVSTKILVKTPRIAAHHGSLNLAKLGCICMIDGSAFFFSSVAKDATEKKNIALFPSSKDMFAAPPNNGEPSSQSHPLSSSRGNANPTLTSPLLSSFRLSPRQSNNRGRSLRVTVLGLSLVMNVMLLGVLIILTNKQVSSLFCCRMRRGLAQGECVDSARRGVDFVSKKFGRLVQESIGYQETKTV
jgi:hypothetical protein